MAIYAVSGFYKYSGTKGKFEGEFSINELGKVVGDIVDHGSRVPQQKVEGMLRVARNIADLSFFKYPPDNELANLLYKLVRKGIAADFSGLYTGLWYALPKAVAVRIEDDRSHAALVLARMPETMGSEYAELELMAIH